jgi:hypothetical protein
MEVDIASFNTVIFSISAELILASGLEEDCETELSPERTGTPLITYNGFESAVKEETPLKNTGVKAPG